MEKSKEKEQKEKKNKVAINKKTGYNKDNTTNKVAYHQTRIVCHFVFFYHIRV